MSKKIIFIVVGFIALLGAGFFVVTRFSSPQPAPATSPGASQQPSSGSSAQKLPASSSGNASAPKSAKSSRIPSSAEIVLYDEKFIYVMDENGGSLTQITKSNPRRWHHVAVSYDHRYIVGSAWVDGNTRNELWLFDLESNTEQQLLASWFDVGNGGVDWDKDGWMYFGATKSEGGLNDMYKLKPDGTGLTQLSNTPMAAEVDVSVLGDKIVYILGQPRASDRTVKSDVWMMKTDGSNAHLVVEDQRRAPPTGSFGLADPELSPDGTEVVYSDDVPGCSNIPLGDFCHNLFIAPVDRSSTPRQITKTGSINIIPDWKGDTIIFTEITSKNGPYAGMSKVSANGANQTPQRIKSGFTFGKWIPK